MQRILFICTIGLLLGACVPMKKYKELQTRYDQCNEDVSKYKSDAIDYGNKVKELEVELGLLKDQIKKLTEDSIALKEKYQELELELSSLKDVNKALEKKYDELLASGSANNAALINDLEQTRIKLQKKEDRLNELEKELNARARALDEKEARIMELEGIIASKDEAVRLLKEKIASALRGFADKGISVEERNGKIYVSMEAKLLFASGKTDVNKEGQTALIDLAKVLEDQKDVGIQVEGHTDTDPMRSGSHPTDNWELSVLRATSVVKIMLGNSEMDPMQISASGRSEFHPVDPDDKAKNRRIEIIITPDLSELFELIANDS